VYEKLGIYNRRWSAGGWPIHPFNFYLTLVVARPQGVFNKLKEVITDS